MTREFFSRSVDFVVVAGLVVAIAWAATALGPLAIDRWF